MEPEETYAEQISSWYHKFNTQQIQSILNECKKDPDNFRVLAKDLNTLPISGINFNDWGHLARMLNRAVVCVKDEKLWQCVSQYYLKGAHYFFPYPISPSNFKNFEGLLKVSKHLQMKEPEKYSDQKHLIMYINNPKSKRTEAFTNGLVELINTQVLVDKKNQNSKSLKINPLITPFIEAEFGKFVPSLERLMVRSENNIEVIVQFLEACGPMPKIDHHASALIKKYKNLFLSKTDFALRLVNMLAQSLSGEECFISSFEFIRGLLSSEHNAKKKIIYLRMLEGFVVALKRYNLSQKLVSEVLAAIASSWIKFVEESEANYVLQILNQILPLVKEPQPQVAQACKASIKSQNKYVLICTGLTLSACYRQAEHFDMMAPVKECFTALKAQLGGFMKKKQASWHFILPIMNFLSAYDLSIVEDLPEINFIFKKSILALPQIQQIDLLNLLFKRYFIYLMKEREQQQTDSILKNSLAINTVILLQSCGTVPRLWDDLLAHAPLQIKLELIVRGLFPLAYLDCQIVARNKTNRYNSLARYLLLKGLGKKLTLKDVDDRQEWLEEIMVLGAIHNLHPNKLIESSEQTRDSLRKISERYLLLAILPQKLMEISDRYFINPWQHSIHFKTINALFQVNPIPALPKINDLLIKILDKKCYETDRSFMQDFEKNLTELVKEFHDQKINQIKDELLAMEYYNEQKIPQKKIYLNPVLDAKMMSEQEVKREQYLEHFNRMLHYYDSICQEILLPNIQKMVKVGAEDALWNANFDPFVHIAQYPEHRMSLQRMVKANFEHVVIQGQKVQEIKILEKLFLRYSNFFADFYSIRGAHLTPPVSLMQKADSFFKELLNTDISPIPKGHYTVTFIEDLSLYVLENMQFDLEVKEQALNFCKFCISRGFKMDNEDELYTLLNKNINIISGCENTESVMLHCMKKVPTKRYGELLTEVLSYVNKTKILILKVIAAVSEKDIQNEEHQKYEPTFEDYIKLRILALDDSMSAQISELASKILSIKSEQNTNISVTIAHFDMKNFIKNNNKDTIQKLCRFMTESISATNVNDVMELVLNTAVQLYDEHFDQEGLEFLPEFLSLNVDKFPDKYLHRIFEILVLRYTANEDYATLSKMSVDVGITIIKKYAPTHGEKLLLSMEGFLTRAKGISNIVFLGVLAPYLKGNKNLNIIEKRIGELFQGDNQVQQRAIAKCMPDLMSFFKNPQEMVQKILTQISELSEVQQTGQSYLASGLLKGLGHKKTLACLERIISKEYPSKSKNQKIGRCCLIRAFVENFGRVIELRGIVVIEILLQYMSDSSEEVRNISKSVGQTFVTKMSSFAIKQLLPPLLSGLENEQNWRIKISYIWILGIMANCAAKQLQSSLPVIVPTLSGCLSNAHPSIRDKASEALKLIGQTIKNPEISNSTDILIEALENPFEKSGKAIELLLKTRFSHFIDPPSLSIVVPIVDYCLRGRVSELKECACQVIGSISQLILKPSDMLPYLRILAVGMKTAVCDPLPEIRSIAAMAIGKISSKIGAEYAKQYFGFIFELINSNSSNTTERTGAAQAYAQLLCSQDYDYFEESLNFIFSKLTDDSNKSIQKEGYILVFLYVPAIRRTEFESFIKEVNENTYCYVSDEEEALRNSSMQVSKVLITNYGISHTELLIEPMCQAIFQANWRKRNAALILLGELLNILKSHMFNAKSNEKAPYYYQALMAVYIMKDDELEMPRITANQVWNMYIENTPKTIRSGLKVLVRMWTRFTHAAGGVVFKNIIGFSGKYAENYFSDILEYLQEYVRDPLHKRGVFDVLGQLFKRMSKDFLSKPVYRKIIRRFFDTFIFVVDSSVREALTHCLALYVEKMQEEEYFEALVYPSIDQMSEQTEENPKYIQMLHLLRDLLKTSSKRVVDRLISKVTQAPLSQFKIQVITNNADKIADNLYVLFKKPATQSMLEESLSLIGQPTKANRLGLLVYCLNQVSIRLNNKFKTQYAHMLMSQLRSLKNQKSNVKEQFLPAVRQLLGMLSFFLQAIELKEIESLEELIGEISPFIFTGDDLIKRNAHRIFMILISDHKAPQTGLYYRQMIVSLENQSIKVGEGACIWSEEEIIKEFISVLVKGLAYGSHQNLKDGLEMIRFFIRNTSPQILKPLIIRVLGPIVRVASYGLFHSEKENLLLFIRQLYASEHSPMLQVYNYQVASVCLRILSESFATNKAVDMTEEIAKTLFPVLARQSSTNNRQLLLEFIISKAKGSELVELLYHLIKSIIQKQPNLLPKSTYNKIGTQFHSQLVNPEEKMPVKGTYLMSKVVAMIHVFLKEENNNPNNTYEDILLYLQTSAQKKEAVPKMQKIELLLRESPREKVFYLLKSIQECREANLRTKQIYTYQYASGLIPESLSGFEDLKDVLDYYD